MTRLESQELVTGMNHELRSGRLLRKIHAPDLSGQKFSDVQIQGAEGARYAEFSHHGQCCLGSWFLLCKDTVTGTVSSVAREAGADYPRDE